MIDAYPTVPIADDERLTDMECPCGNDMSTGGYAYADSHGAFDNTTDDDDTNAVCHTCGRVIAPDGRVVGRFDTTSAAFVAAQSDYWKAF